MNKTEFLKAIAEDANVSIKDASAVFESMQNVIVKGLADGERITVTGFGTFEAKHRNARTCRNPQTGETVSVPAKVVPSFKPGNLLKEALK